MILTLVSIVSSYDDKARVTTVFGTGRAVTTDSPGLIGEINTPTDAIFSVDENYLYLTDLNGGGLLRKLVVTNSGISNSDVNFNSLYGIKTVFTGLPFVIIVACVFHNLLRG